MSPFSIYTNAQLRHFIRMMRRAPLANRQARTLCRAAIDYAKCRKMFCVDKGGWDTR